MRTVIRLRRRRQKLPSDNFKISIVFILMNMCTTFYYTYLAQQLKWFGFNAQEIGTLLMVYVLMAVVSMPLMGYLTDNYVSDKLMIRLNLIISALSSIVFFLVDKTFINMILVISVWSFSFKPIINLVESYTYKLINEGDPVEFGIVRSMGSFGFAIGALIMGVIIDFTSYNSLFVMQIIGVVAAGIASDKFFRKIDRHKCDETVCEVEPVVVPETISEVIEDFQDIKKNIKEDIKEELHELKQEKPNAVKLLLKNRDYVFLVLGAFFINAAVSLHFTYMPLLLEENGASAGQIGLSFSLMALAEVPIIAFIRKIQMRIKPSTLIIVAGIVYMFRMVMAVHFPTVEMFMIMGLLQSITLGFCSPNYIFMMNNIVQREITSTAILTGFTIIYNLSAVFTMYFGGYYIEKLGYAEVLQYDWVFALIGTIIFILNFKVIKNKNRQHGI